MEKKRIKTYKDLEVFNLAFTSAMKVFELSKSFPAAERYSLVDQVRRSSRSVCTNIVEAFRKRRYPASFVSKLSDADGEAGETQLWIELAAQCGYLEKNKWSHFFKTTISSWENLSL